MHDANFVTILGLKRDRILFCPFKERFPVTEVNNGIEGAYFFALPIKI